MKKRAFFFLLLSGLASLSFSQQVNMDSLYRVINKPHDDSGKVNAYHILAAMTAGTNATTAIEHSQKGIALAKQVGFLKGLASCYLNVSYCYGILNNLQEAVLYADSGITCYRKLDNAGALAMCFHQRADYKMRLASLKQSLSDCDSSLFYAEKSGRTGARRQVYKIMASIYYMQKDYVQSKVYYEKVYKEFESRKDSITMADLLSKLGNVYTQQKAYAASIAYYEKAIAIATSIRQENNLSEYYSNLSNAWLKKGDRAKAEINALKAIRYAKSKKNKLHLATAQNMLSAVYITTDSTNAAIQSAAEGYSIATGIAAIDARQRSAAALAEGYFKIGDFENAFHYLKISSGLTDSMSKNRYDKDIVELQTRFKVNEKDNEIILLGKNKELQEQKIEKQQLLIIGAAVSAILALTGIGLLMNRNKLRHRMKQLELRNQIAADLHDEVGSSLSSIHLLSQMATRQNQGEAHSDILSRMSNHAKETIDKMGDIVWMIKPGESEAVNLKQRIERFAYDICSARNIGLSLQLDDLDNVKLSLEQRKNIYLVFKEALNNAVKYSGAEQVWIAVVVQNKNFALSVRDSGLGFDISSIVKGNGLENITHRTRELGGKLEIDSVTGKGTTVKLSIPV